MIDDLLELDESRSISWNYVNRVDKELGLSNGFQQVVHNSLLPSSYRQIISIVARASNHSHTALLLDDEEKYVAFMFLLDENAIPFLLEELDEVYTPMPSVYKVFYNTQLASGNGEDSGLNEFLSNVVIPDLNDNFESWTSFKLLE